ncbi:MAG: retropepsin-like domain-containing protein [Candidatus Omnitrophica bacterium]|nr:retropepsin-like domain-containing protein [Candidatus Omnitrophota bacterium]
MSRRVSFAFERRPSSLFGTVYQPTATAFFWSRKINGWVRLVCLVDTGADYTLLPRARASDFGIDLTREGQPFSTYGIGASERVVLLPRWPMKLGSWMRQIPMGFINRDDLPPILGRQDCLETFKLTLFQHRTAFSLR